MLNFSEILTLDKQILKIEETNYRRRTLKEAHNSNLWSHFNKKNYSNNCHLQAVQLPHLSSFEKRSIKFHYRKTTIIFQPIGNQKTL